MTESHLMLVILGSGAAVGLAVLGLWLLIRHVRGVLRQGRYERSGSDEGWGEVRHWWWEQHTEYDAPEQREMLAKWTACAMAKKEPEMKESGCAKCQGRGYLFCDEGHYPCSTCGGTGIDPHWLPPSEREPEYAPFKKEPEGEKRGGTRMKARAWYEPIFFTAIAAGAVGVVWSVIMVVLTGCRGPLPWSVSLAVLGSVAAAVVAGTLTALCLGLLIRHVRGVMDKGSLEPGMWGWVDTSLIDMKAAESIFAPSPMWDLLKKHQGEAIPEPEPCMFPETMHCNQYLDKAEREEVVVIGAHQPYIEKQLDEQAKRVAPELPVIIWHNHECRRLRDGAIVVRLPSGVELWWHATAKRKPEATPAAKPPDEPSGNRPIYGWDTLPGVEWIERIEPIDTASLGFLLDKSAAYNKHYNLKPTDSKYKRVWHKDMEVTEEPRLDALVSRVTLHACEGSTLWWYRKPKTVSYDSLPSWWQHEPEEPPTEGDDKQKDEEKPRRFHEPKNPHEFRRELREYMLGHQGETYESLGIGLAREAAKATTAEGDESFTFVANIECKHPQAQGIIHVDGLAEEAKQVTPTEGEGTC